MPVWPFSTELLVLASRLESTPPPPQEWDGRIFFFLVFLIGVLLWLRRDVLVDELLGTAAAPAMQTKKNVVRAIGCSVPDTLESIAQAITGREQTRCSLGAYACESTFSRAGE